MKVFSGDELTLALRLGTDGKAYYPDTRYTVYEDEQRSCADLDLELAEYNTQLMCVSTPVMMTAFNELFDMADMEPASSTPLHLQLVKMDAECRVLRYYVHEALAVIEFDGTPPATKDVFRSLVGFVSFGFSYIRSMANGGPDIAADPFDEDFGQGRLLELLGLPKGFPEFARRMLSRMLQY